MSLEQKQSSAAAEGGSIGSIEGSEIEEDRIAVKQNGVGVAEGSGFEPTRASITALEGGLVARASEKSADDYLRPIKAAGKAATPWLKALARQVPTLRDWWRCVASSMSIDSPAGTADRRKGLIIMLQAAVTSSSEVGQSQVIDRLFAWAGDWRDREGHLRRAMHE